MKHNSQETHVVCYLKSKYVIICITNQLPQETHVVGYPKFNCYRFYKTK